MSVLAALRQATQAQHHELEAKAGILQRLATPTGRRDLLQAFLALYQPAEAALRPRLAPIPDLDFEARRKTPALRCDLQALGAPTGLSAVHPPPRFASAAEALGFAYVLEGSTLGGRVIRKRLLAEGLSLDGAGFFDVYGAQTGPRWKDFCAILERECAGLAHEAVAGGLAGFAYVRGGLVPEAACAS